MNYLTEALTDSTVESLTEAGESKELIQLLMAEELRRCSEDVAFFIDTYIFIQDTQGFTTIPFKLWQFQRDVLTQFDSNKRVIILKGRQLGISQLIANYALHQAYFNNNANVMMLSQGEREAQKLLRKAIFSYNQLPRWMRDWRPRINDSKKEMEFEKKDENGDVIHTSTIVALPATEEAGRSETGSLVLADEWAFHVYALENWSALSPTIDMGGSFIGVSTANGLGNFYHKTWMGAEAKKNGFHPIFLEYSLRPGRDLSWYEETRDSYTDVKLFNQEHPRNPREAFITTSGCVFDLDGLQYIAEQTALEPMDAETIAQTNDVMALFVVQNQDSNIQVWVPPRVGQQFIIGADPAGGDGGDNSAATVIDSATGEHVASIVGQLDPDTFAGVLAELGRLYNNALLVVERNNHGHAVILALRNTYDYGNIFIYKKNRKTKEGDNKLGWPTNSKTKALMISGLQVEIKNRTLSMKDIEFVHEAQAFIRKGGDKVGAEEGMMDDRVVSLGLAKVGASHDVTNRGRPRRPSQKKSHFRRQHV